MIEWTVSAKREQRLIMYIMFNCDLVPGKELPRENTLSTAWERCIDPLYTLPVESPFVQAVDRKHGLCPHLSCDEAGPFPQEGDSDMASKVKPIPDGCRTVTPYMVIKGAE